MSSKHLMWRQIKSQVPNLYVGMGIFGSARVAGSSVLSPQPTPHHSQLTAVEVITVGGDRR